MIENGQGLLARDGKSKIIKFTKMVSTSGRNQPKHLCGYVIRRKLQWWRDHHTRFWGLAVVTVKIPFTTDRFTAIHQNIMIAPHVTIEKIHTQLAAAIGPAGKPTQPA